CLFIVALAAQNTGEFGAICMHKMMFPSESCNSVSKGTFREFRPFSAIAENHWPYSLARTLPIPSPYSPTHTHTRTVPSPSPACEARLEMGRLVCVCVCVGLYGLGMGRVLCVCVCVCVC